MNQTTPSRSLLLSITIILSSVLSAFSQVPVLPSDDELNRPFANHDLEAFKSPAKVFHPETWFHYIGGNVSHEGITADLEAISKAGISGIQLFHGQFGGAWPGVEPQITMLTPEWESAVRHTAQECRRLGLRFTMQNCPGWAMAGGPWIEPSNAMRHLAWSRTDITGAKGARTTALEVPQPGSEEWRDYQDIAVLAFPTPLGDTAEPLKPLTAESKDGLPWKDFLSGLAKESITLSPATENNPYQIEVTFVENQIIRTVEFPSVNSMNHAFCYEPGVTVTVQAIMDNGETRDILHTQLPSSNWQDESPVSFACPEVKNVSKYRISIVNKNDIVLNSLRLLTAARKNNWESEAGWTLRTIERTGEHPVQSPEAFIDPSRILDITAMMDDKGNLNWDAPAGEWTILRIGHINTGMKNGPAPAEGTGWECDKLSLTGSRVHFNGYIGKLIGDQGPLKGELLDGMLLDSWECKTQTWTNGMESEFTRVNDYDLRKWLPAVFGYVVGDHETTTRFLHDWRSTIGELFAENFFGNMSRLAKENGLSISYETAAGDVFPADILEYFKYADVPMCEFWQPFGNGFVGSLNFKPIKPTASAARMYGKPRVAAEAFTSFALTWDEKWSMLKEVANFNSIEGVTHMIFHTYTHNPRTDFLPPGTSFGSGIGTPFLRGQTWWKDMPEFTSYLSRCSYMLERGRPVSDVLWYLGDEINHKPDQNAPFPAGYKYDYCNPDVLLNRLTVRDGMIVTPEGISYRVLWLPDAPRMLPQTLEKLHSLINEGAIVIGDAPQGIVTLVGGVSAMKRFDAAVKNIWGKNPKKGIRKIGKGSIVSGMDLACALKELAIAPDVTGGDALWTHRTSDGADWYFVCSPVDGEFRGSLDFRCNGQVEIWDPVTGTSTSAVSRKKDGYTSVELDLPRAGSCFVVFRHSDTDGKNPEENKEKVILASSELGGPWILEFPEGWDAPASMEISGLQPWKELDISPEAKAFSGNVTYKKTFEVGELNPGASYSIDLGKVEMIASVYVNGKPVRTLWSPPYRADITDAVQSGMNELTIEVTSTWFNRLAYDAGQPEADRKTWTIGGPAADSPLRESGLLGPVVLFRSE